MSNKNITFKTDLFPGTTGGPYNLGSSTQKWQINGVADPKLTDTTYSTGTTNVAGLTKLYTSTGTATDGTMTQAAIKSALDGKANSSHGNHVPAKETADHARYLRNDNTWQTITPEKIGAAVSDHIHFFASSDSVGGSAKSAVKLDTARTIGIGTGAVGTATSFDGSANITIPVTEVKESYLSWGGKSLSASVTPIGMSLSTELNPNRLAFINGDALTFEYSSDGGATWTNYNYSANVKSQVCTLSYSVPIGRPDNSTEYFINQSRTRITLAAQGYVYTSPKKMLIRMSSAPTCNMLVEYKTGEENATWLTYGTYQVSGWSEWNDIPLVLNTLGGNSTQYENIWFLRLTFYPIVKNTSYPKTCDLLSIRIYGNNNWDEASSINKKGPMSGTGHLYDYDMYANATFPAQITAAQFNGALNGNASTATSIGTEAGVNTSINRLSTSSSIPMDNDYYIAQYAGGGTTTTTYHRRLHSALWNYIKSKISSVLGLTAASYGGKAATAGTADTANNVAWANTNHPTFATVATSGSYNDLLNKPSIPSAVTESTVASWGFTKNTGTLTASSTLDATKLSGTIPSSCYTDTNTWRPVVNNLTSTATDSSLSAAQGKALKDMIDNLPTPMQFKGSLGAGGTKTSLDAASTGNAGHTYKVIATGTYASQTAKVGDLFISNGSSWVLIPSGDDIEDTWRPLGTGANDAAAGNHNHDGVYLKSFTETDPVFSASAAAGITSTDISNWNSKGSSNLALGETSTTAYRGDRGATAYTHSTSDTGKALSSGLYKITTSARGHVTAGTIVTKADITAITGYDIVCSNQDAPENGTYTNTIYIQYE